MSYGGSGGGAGVAEAGLLEKLPLLGRLPLGVDEHGFRCGLGAVPSGPRLAKPSSWLRRGNNHHEIWMSTRAVSGLA